MTECMKCGKQEGVLRWDTELPLVCYECYFQLLKERWDRDERRSKEK